MTPLLLAILLASLTGSLHCAGMCGAFVAISVGAHDPRPSEHTKPSPRIPLLIAYNLGRLLTYATLGLIAGALGSALNLSASTFLGLQQAAAIAAGSLMILFGLLTIARIRGIRVPHLHPPRALATLAAKGHRFAFSKPPVTRALVIGLLTTLLPCGWLYAFVIVAAGTAHPVSGVLVMAAFWVGTLPVLLALGAGIRSITGPLAAQLPAITALIITAVGVFTVVSRANLPSITPDSVARAANISHEPSSTTDLTNTVNNLDAHDMPCCSQPKD